MTHQTQRRRRRHSAVCHRHPTSKPTTGFCASCLHERLSTIEALSSSSSSVSVPDKLPNLRRLRSYSVRDSSSAADPDLPRRRSCDVKSNNGGDDDEYPLESSIRFPIITDSKEEEEEEIIGFDEEEIEDGEKKKTMKELIDLESRNPQIKKSNSKDIASVLSRTLKRFSLRHHKNNEKNPESGEHGGLRRRSCDVDPRQAGRVSFEEPRASWDGCLIGKTYPKLIPLSSVTEDAKASPEKITGAEEDGEEEEGEEKKPGGSAQTRDYYNDSRRRRSFDRSLSRHGLVDFDELKAKVSPENVGLFHGAKLLVTESELRDSNWYSIKNYKPESFELGSNGVGCVASGGEVKQDGFALKKSGKKWSKGWNFWGLIQMKTDTTTTKKKKDEIKNEQSLKLGGNAMEGSLAESLLKLRRVTKGETNGEKLIRSYSVSARKSCDGMYRGASVVNGLEGGRSSCDGLFHGSVASVETGRRSLREDGVFRGIDGKRNELLHRETKLGSTYSPDNLRNGMVRFYLTPIKSHTNSNFKEK
ncbi:unnamed protein product [Cochlearia groenlandica]